MVIESIDRNANIKVERYEDETYNTFEIEVNIDIEHGRFFGVNKDLQLLSIDIFINDLNALIKGKKQEAVLYGTYESFFRFFKSDTGEMMLSFFLGDSYCGYANTVDYGIKGCFAFDEVSLNKILMDFHEMCN